MRGTWSAVLHPLSFNFPGLGFGSVASALGEQVPILRERGSKGERREGRGRQGKHVNPDVRLMGIGALGCI